MNLNKTMQNLGLNGTIVIALLLMVIVYYLHLIEKNTSLERFNIGAQTNNELEAASQMTAMFLPPAGPLPPLDVH